MADVELADIKTVKAALAEVLYPDGFPIVQGAPKYQLNLLKRLYGAGIGGVGGGGGEEKELKNIIYDNILAYYYGAAAGGLPNVILAGTDDTTWDSTPVGSVLQRTPLDITSFLYPAGLGVQVIEEGLDILKLLSSDPKPIEMQKAIWDIEKEAKKYADDLFKEKEAGGKKGAPAGAVRPEDLQYGGKPLDKKLADYDSRMRLYEENLQEISKRVFGGDFYKTIAQNNNGKKHPPVNSLRKTKYKMKHDNDWRYT